MGRILITAIVLYLLYVVGYLVWERQTKRRRNGARGGDAGPKRASPADDIMGKSRFDLRPSRPQATTTPKVQQALKKRVTFDAGMKEQEL